MDLTQSKLSKAEWLNIEIAVSEQELPILHLIRDGYHDVNLRRNDTQSLVSYMKIDPIPEIVGQLYKQYFEQEIEGMKTKYASEFCKEKTAANSSTKKSKVPPLKTRDLIRIQSMDSKIDTQRTKIFEYILLDMVKEILISISSGTPKYAFYLYTLVQLKKATIPNLNPRVVEFIDYVTTRAELRVRMRDVLHQSYQFIEKNLHLLKYEDRTLFNHQKQLFTIFKQSPVTPKLVLYIAPTGTGKTLSPLGLSEGHRIIFICAARHVGLALAKSAISVGKRVAFAFGCETASDIRLHYFAASDYTRNKRSGGIGKVDNTVGDKVEIMICDVQSYLTAMHYMLAFSPKEEEEAEGEKYRDADLITYWDEPTITMDYSDHPLHEIIHRNWTENHISKMVLSCATLPKDTEIQHTIADFCSRFSKNPEIHTISSFDCRKSISVLNKSGFSVVPHLLFEDYTELQTCITHCTENKTLLRYFDLTEIVALIDFVHAEPGRLDPTYMIETYFASGIQDITMNNMKLYYLEVLRHIIPAQWPFIYNTMKQNQLPKFAGNAKIQKARSMEMSHLAGTQLSRTQSMVSTSATASATSSATASAGILLTTEDSHTLTDGPTIFLAEDVEKVGRFYVQQSQIPARIYQSVSEKIAQNSTLQQKMDVLMKTLEDKAAGDLDKEKKIERETLSPEVKRLLGEIESVREQIKVVALDSAYVPNTMSHQRVWVKGDKLVENAFVPKVDDDSIRDIMALDVPDHTKLLLLLGIGVFVEQKQANPQYMEVIKRLAYNQQLFLILASSDYIYGTNYQFCHGFIGKDLTQMTQQKTIQAMGRIGRNQMQQEYTVRFRDDTVLLQLFQTPSENREADMMSRLFCE